MSEPEPDAVLWERLHPATLKVTALTMVGVAVAAGVPTALGIASGTSLAVALAWVLPGAVLLVGAVTGADLLRLRHARYRITATRLEFESGIVFRTRRSLARERIRSVDLSAHPLLRVFGLVRVKVGTGETGSGEGSATEQTIDLDSVSRAAGDRLRTELLRRGAATDDGRLDGERLATWQPAWIRFAPLSFVTPLLAASLVGAIFQVAEWFGRGGLPVQITRDLVDRFGAWPVLGAGVALFVLAGALGSVALHGEAWWNHRLDREPGGTLRVQRGLLVSRSLSLEEKRIRGIEVVEPLGFRSAGGARLDVVAIGLKSQESGSDLTTLLPPAPKDVVLMAARTVIGPIGDGTVAPHPRTARARRLRWATAAALGLLVAVVTVQVLWSPPVFWAAVLTLVAAVAAGWAFWAALDAYASLGHTLDDRYLVARRGTVRRATVHLQRDGIIGYRIRQSLFQRRLGLLTVDATTAAGRGHYPTVDADEHEGLDFAADAVPGLLEPFLVRGDEAAPADGA